MGRYVYEPAKVESAVAELNNALSALADVTAEFEAAASTIKGARGAEYIDVNFGPLNELEVQAEETIETDIATIQEKAQAIEDYNNSGFLVKLFSSAGMALTKFGEGVLSGLEDIGDGFVSMAGAVGGLFNSDFKNACAEYVAKDHVGDAFAKSYEDGILSGINKYSWFSHTSTAANVFKGVGTAAPYIAMAATGAGTGLQMAAAGVSGLGRKTETELQKAISAANEAGNTDFKAGDAFYSAFGKGVVTGVKDAALVWGMNKASQIAQGSKSTALMDPNNPVPAAENIFTKAGSSKFAGKLSAADDAFSATAQTVGSKASNLVSKIPVVGKRLANAPSTAKNILTTVGTKLTNAPVVGKIISATGSAVTKHPGATFAALGTVYTADKVAHTDAGTVFRVSEKARVASTAKEIDPEIEMPVGDVDPNYNPDDTTTDPIPTEPSNEDNGGGDTTPYSPSGSSNNSYQQPTGNNNTSSNNNNQNSNQDNSSSNNNNQNSNQDNSSSNNNQNSNQDNSSSNNNQNSNNGDTSNPSNNGGNQSNGSQNGGSQSGNNQYGGGGFSNNGYTGETSNPTDPNAGKEEIFDEETVSGSLSDLIGGNDYVEVPTSSTPISTTTTATTKKSVIPVIAGLGAATVAGIGTKAYLDKKEHVDDDEEDFETEEWEGDEQMDLNYGDDTVNIDEEERDYLNPTDEYAYQEDQVESYQAVNSSELESMQ